MHFVPTPCQKKGLWTLSLQGLGFSSWIIEKLTAADRASSSVSTPVHFFPAEEWCIVSGGAGRCWEWGSFVHLDLLESRGVTVGANMLPLPVKTPHWVNKSWSLSFMISYLSTWRHFAKGRMNVIISLHMHITIQLRSGKCCLNSGWWRCQWAPWLTSLIHHVQIGITSFGLHFIDFYRNPWWMKHVDAALEINPVGGWGLCFL